MCINGTCGFHRFVMLGAILAVAWLSAAERAAGQGSDFTWTGGGTDDSFHDPANWGEVSETPGTEDRAIWQDGPGYAPRHWTVEFLSGTTNSTAALGQISNDTTIRWDLWGHHYMLSGMGSAITDAGIFLQRATLTVTNGHLTTGTCLIGAGNLTGNLVLTGPGTTWNSLNTIPWRTSVFSDNSSLRIENGARATLAGMRIINAGANTGNVFVVGETTSVTNTGALEMARRGAISIITLSDGAKWTQSGAFSDMYDPARPIGTIILNLDGGSMHVSHSGGIDLSDPTPTMLNFTLHGGVTNATLTLEGNLDFGTNTVLSVSLDEGFTAEAGDVFALIKYDGALTGEFKDLPDGSVLEIEDKSTALGGYEFIVNYDAGAESKEVTLTTKAVPPRGTIFMFR